MRDTKIKISLNRIYRYFGLTPKQVPVCTKQAHLPPYSHVDTGKALYDKKPEDAHTGDYGKYRLYAYKIQNSTHESLVSVFDNTVTVGYFVIVTTYRKGEAPYSASKCNMYFSNPVQQPTIIAFIETLSQRRVSIKLLSNLLKPFVNLEEICNKEPYDYIDYDILHSDYKAVKLIAPYCSEHKFHFEGLTGHFDVLRQRNYNQDLLGLFTIKMNNHCPVHVVIILDSNDKTNIGTWSIKSLLNQEANMCVREFLNKVLTDERKKPV